MSEFTSILSGKLAIPEACRECPRIHQLEQSIAERQTTIEQELTATAFASPRTARRVALGDRDPQRAVADRRVSELFDGSDELLRDAQLETMDISSDCIGPMRGELSSRLGTKAIVTVCGSAALEVSSQHETAHVERGFTRPGSSEE
jgi:hypothetical protein